MILPVVMAGGSGSRLWPMSRAQFPKQFLALTSELSMLQSTCARLDGVNVGSPMVICGEAHRFTVAEQLRFKSEYHDATIVLEPSGRNTAPAVALAALTATAQEDDPILLVLAADHDIRNQAAFQDAVNQAEQLAKKGELVTFGIVPTAPETGYGYIRKGEGCEGAFRVAEFVEKPASDVAQGYLDDGGYLWNSGMFMFRASRYLEELGQYRPDILQACREAMAGAQRDVDFLRPNPESFERCPSESIDYAVMEKTTSAVVVPVDCGWSDVGSWSALWDISEKDSDNNALAGDVMVEATTNSYVRSDSKLIAAVGLESVVIVESDDAIMVSSLDRVQDVKRIVERLNEDRRSEALSHRKVFRPWGYYDSVDSGKRFQVKRIVVAPGQQLSLQMHHHRAEHWIVVSGTAKVTRGDDVFLVAENESTYIPLGVKHRLENPGAIPLEMIEVQSGSYLGEDDIVRFEDTYGRG
ncbi:MAG: mannose-1-phosphate guanylyltransferase/mannose-6-phosphate isomerase [Cellvibrionaceae bacterium]|nr:mannose-1-phosphate guanylyltransferase/mannose-6-phosphate isomerase [Cellvibrionaceae bacterium]